MMKLAVAALALLALIGSATAEPEKIGTATLIRTSVNGNYGEMVIKGPIHRNERIRTSKSGLGEFLFRDGTKLAIGWGSNIVVDSFVFDDAGSVKKLTLKAAKGTFRWISGKSKSTAYQINTPSGTIGVRGTKFDFYVGPDGTTAVVLLSGAAQFCGSGGCVQLRNRCDCVIAKRGTRPAVSRANRRFSTRWATRGRYRSCQTTRHYQVGSVPVLAAVCQSPHCRLRITTERLGRQQHGRTLPRLP